MVEKSSKLASKVQKQYSEDLQLPKATAQTKPTTEAGSSKQLISSSALKRIASKEKIGDDPNALSSQLSLSSKTKVTHQSTSASTSGNNTSGSIKTTGKGRQLDQFNQMLATPTNNFGLAKLFKNFVLLGEQYQIEECSRLAHQFTEQLEKSLVAQDENTFNTYLRLVKRIAYECPIIHISDTFFRLLHKYVFVPLSHQNLSEDHISVFFDLTVCPKVLNLPTDVDLDTGEVIRAEKGEDLEQVYDEYNQAKIPVKKLLDEIFYDHGRIRPHERILCWFPKYLDLFCNTNNMLIKKSQILKLDQKLYLGIMAASCYNCEYLINILEEQFVLQGGDLQWIVGGLRKVEPRLAKFGEINEIMAMRPWAIKPFHLEKLLKRDENGHGWNVQQVLVGACVLAHFHGLCSFVLGQGLTEDLERVDEQLKLQKNDSQKSLVYDDASGSDADILVQQFLKEYGDKRRDQSEDSSQEGDDDDGFMDEEDSQHSYSDSNSVNKKPSGKIPEASCDEDEDDENSRYRLHKLNLIRNFENFDNKSEYYLDTDEFNWEQHVYSVMQKYDPNVAEAMNEQSEYAFSMTKKLYGTDEVDTSPFRLAIQMYLMYIHGIRDDAFPYAIVNKVLHYVHKVFIKRIMCEPNNITNQDFIQLTKLTPEERCHVCILVMETKKRVELIYLTRAMSQFVNL